ncbi:hypothetical protein BU26DRAFT_71693 [Trematosphaeria pertusa]|uniref:Uncharacterized protein n=1 Tax=Trematosphaeria pertusa TaxID=390896 RepID=A0A6A6I6A7_9PLEO|nr:uncharacterized protein BU26DRAFT_71693 [Trematosphaeria pertusa]KAF2245598.1 hypothetical protein BU26DRAFT_71693 [Trematosphaeria pertusa]
MEIQIDFHNRGSIPVDAEAFLRWFPRLAPEVFGTGWFEADRLAWEVHSHMHGRLQLSPKSVRSTLQSLFGMLQLKLGHHNGATRRKVKKMLERQLEQDLTFARLRADGNRRSRHRFLTLCIVACSTDSQLLADALVRFFYDNLHDIMRSEEPHLLLREWAVGIQEIRSLIPEETFMDLMYHLSRKANKMIPAWRNFGIHDPSVETLVQIIYDILGRNNYWDYDRGRRPRRRAWVPDYAPRALTAPPLFHSHPRLALTGPEPLMTVGPRLHSPALSAPVVDEVDEIRMRQEMLENQVQQLQEEVEFGVPEYV